MMALAVVTWKNAKRPEVQARALRVFGPAAARFLPHETPATPSPVELDPPVATLYEAPKPAAEPSAPDPSEETDDTSDTSSDVAAPAAPHTTPSMPGSPDAELDDALAKADAATKKADYLTALNVFRALGKTHGDDPRVLHGWADAAVKTKGWGEALRVAVRWGSADASPEAQLYLARIQRSAGQRYGAVATLTRLVEQHPELTEARDLLDRYSDRKLAAR
jgi:hypothetical protein